MRDLFAKLKDHTFIKYLSVSAGSLVLDTAIVYVLYLLSGKELLWANTAGLVAGFLFTFLLSHFVFNAPLDWKGFAIYLGTFFLGMILANGIILYSNQLFLPSLGRRKAFLVAKGLSIVLPFFIMYAIRKRLFQLKEHS